jgi:undecaprenyl diphosphate synthase
MKELLHSLSPSDPDWRVANQIDPLRLPAHIAIIMDGNGRWAKQRNYPRIIGHRAGVTVVGKIVETCAQIGLEALTLYAFSVENWKRPRLEAAAALLFAQRIRKYDAQRYSIDGHWPY